MYKVKKPFLTRPGQFEDGKQSLAVGIKANALNGDGDFQLELTSEEDKIYWKSKKELKDFALNKKSFWQNREGTMVAIFPMTIFNIKEVGQKRLFK